MIEKVVDSQEWERQQTKLLALMEQYVALELGQGQDQLDREIGLQSIVAVRTDLQRTAEQQHEWTVWDNLVELFDLDDFEVFALLAVFSAEVMEDMAVAFATLQKGPAQPTADCIIGLYQGVHQNVDVNLRKYFAFDRPLAQFFLDDGYDKSQPYYQRQLRLRTYMRGCLLGGQMGHALLEEVCSTSKTAADAPVFGNGPVYDKLVEYCATLPQRLWDDGSVEQLWLLGDKGIGKKFFAQKVAQCLEKEPLFIHVDRILALEPRQVGDILTDLVVHTLLGDYQPCLTDVGSSPEQVDQLKELLGVLQKDLPFLVVCAQEKLPVAEGQRFVLSLEDWGSKDTLAFWQYHTQHLTLDADLSLQDLVNRYVLSPRQILDVIAVATMHSGGAETATKADFVFGVKQMKQHVLGQYAQLIHSPFTWNDMVLETSVRQQLEMICNQVKWKDVVGEDWGFFEKLPYGRGISALFYGPPGTGKTMAAQALANTLQLDLYRIDSSQLISKYIGETQKNIAQLFDKAKKINAILFFDEADALFSKRSEVSNSNDKHANAETALLLQRFESYDGIVILASNYMNNMDAAFQRRIKFILKFELPDVTMREEIWRKALPAKALHGNLDFHAYAKDHELAGSEIKEILLNAAFMAVNEGSRLEHAHIQAMIRLHYRKKGKPLFF